MILRFEECELDTGRYELRRGGEAVPVEPQVFDLLRMLIENRDRIVTKDELFAEVWEGRIVSDATLNSRINAARKAIGDNGTDQRLIRTAPRRGFRFVGEVAGGEAEPPKSLSPLALRQEVQFCTSPGGVGLAYSSVGEGMPLVKAANWLNHLEYDWESPLWHETLEHLATGRQLIRYDERGTGLSDWDVDDISFDAFVRDLETVVDAAGLDRFALFGMSQGCAVSIAYAVRHPERVSRLILLGGYLQGRIPRGDMEGASALQTLIRQGWGDRAFGHASGVLLPIPARGFQRSGQGPRRDATSFRAGRERHAHSRGSRQYRCYSAGFAGDGAHARHACAPRFSRSVRAGSPDRFLYTRCPFRIAGGRKPLPAPRTPGMGSLHERNRRLPGRDLKRQRRAPSFSPLVRQHRLAFDFDLHARVYQGRHLYQG